MASFRFSNRALGDLDAIVEYTIRTWDEDQAARYVGILEAASQRVADVPAVGRSCDHIRPGLWRFKAGSHVLFFRRLRNDVLICRILHYRMLPEHQPIGDEDE